jgi:type II restriction/modification system DNA methylase subunit YeeA
MSKESLKKFFNDLEVKDGLKQGLIDYCGKPENKDVAAKLFAEYANKNGYDVTEAEFYDYLVTGDADVKSKSDAEAVKIKALKDEELKAVSGGWKKEKDECRSTYKSYENCVWTDECSHINNEYHYNKDCRSSYRDKETCLLVDKCGTVVCSDY